MGLLEIKHLRMLTALAESENMTRAARRLCISQSALSQQLKDIETKLDVALFFRTPKKMVLTPVGRRLLERAGGVIETVEAAEMAIVAAGSAAAGTLKVGTQCIFCYKWLPHVLRTFHQRFPAIEIEIGNAQDPKAELADGRFDIVVTAVPGSDDACVYMPLFEDQLVCIMPPGHELNSAPFVPLAAFRREKLISHAERERTKFYRYVLRPKGIEPAGLMTVGAPNAIVAMVAAGFGLSVFPDWAIRSAVTAGTVSARPITRGGLPLTWRAVYLTESRSPTYQQAFIQIITHLHLAGIRALPDDPATAA
ncbi:MAG: LysR family transcriptional regulator [Desulfosarcinaceae bacterium]|nr:LysR family transcriptional regulator [Desulfosarcinaceae bacterium]